MAYRVLITGTNTPERGPIWPASAWMSYADALRFAREWLAFDPSHPVRIVPGNGVIAYTYTR